jgi:streptogramin lyase
VSFRTYSTLPANGAGGAITKGPDGGIWMANGLGPGAYVQRFSPAGRMEAHGFPEGYPDAYPEDMVWAADGRLWAIQGGTQPAVMYRYTLGGPAEALLVPSSGYLSSIAAGPDALWYAGVTLWRVSFGLEVSEYLPPLGPAYAVEVARDGAVWLGYRETGRVGVFRPGLGFTDLPLADPDSRLDDMEQDGAGRMWYTDYVTDRVGFFDTAGVRTDFLVPCTDCYPTRITTGPDGAMWFVESFPHTLNLDVGSIVRLAADGSWTRYFVPADLNPPQDLVLGPDGNLWLSTLDHPFIGRFVLGGTTIGTGPCAPSEHVLCLDDQPGDRRFRVEVEYHTARNGGLSGSGHALPLDTLGVRRGGLFWFFSQDNPEVVVKVLDGCAVNDRRWIFASGGTDLALTIMVEDVVTSEVHTYYNLDQQPFAPVQDVNAIDCTP